MNSKKEKNVSSANIAFLVSSKNAIRIRQFLETHIDDFSSFNIIATLTEGKELENVSGVKIQYVPALEQGGCGELANRVKKGQVAAVFVFNPAAVFAVDFKIQPLLDACWLSDTHICFNLELVDFVFSQLSAAHRGNTGSKKSTKTEQISGKALFTLQNQLPTFDRPVDQALKTKREDFVARCAIQQLEFLFGKIHHAFLPMNDLLPLFINRDNKAEVQKEIVGIGKFFEFTPTNFLRIKVCQLDWSIKFLTLGEGADLRKFWDYETYKRDFLITHHVFIPSVDLVRALKHFFRMAQPEGLDEDEVGDLKPAPSVLKLIEDWILMEFGADFQENDDLARELENFIKEDIMKYNATIGLELQQLLHAAIQLELPFPLTSEQQKLAPRPIIHKKMKFDEITFWSLSPVEVARQMTLLDESLFHKILAKEFLGGAWTKSDAMVKAPNLTKFISHTNRMANFVITEILNERTQQNIADCITFWIKVAETFKELNNFSGLMNVLTALHSATIGRCRFAWDIVEKDCKESFDALTESLSLLGHFKNYRETLRNIKDPTLEPIVPLIAVTCSDLNGLNEVLENKTDDGWINFDKHQKFAEHIWSVKRLMRSRYNFKVVPEIKNYIEKAKVLSGSEHGEKIMSIIGKYRNEFCKDEAIIKAEKDRPLRPEFVPAFNTEITEKEWQTLEKQTKGQSLKFSKGEMILDFGIPNKYFWRVKKGSVKGELSDLLTKSQVCVFKEKSFFGELGLINENSLTTFSYIAEENCEIIKTDIRIVAQELVNLPAISEKLNKILAAKLAEKLKNFGKTPDTQHSTRKIALLATRNDELVSSGSFSSIPTGTTPRDQEIGKSTAGSFLKRKKKDNDMLEKSDSKLGIKRSPSSRSWKVESSTSSELSKVFKLKSSDTILNVVDCTFKNCRGKLFLTKKHVHFYGASFGRKIKESFLISLINNIQCDEKKDEIIISIKEIDFMFKDFGKIMLKEANNILVAAMNNISYEVTGADDETVEEDEVTIAAEEIPNSILNLADRDWDHILEAARPTHYGLNKTVISQDQEQQQRVYHIDKGSCRIEKELEDGQIIQIATINEGTIFGEISFLEGLGSRATATVISSDEETVITVIEGFFLDILFDYFPGLNGRFYHYLAFELFKRLNHRYVSMNEQQNKRQEKPEKEDLMSIISSPPKLSSKESKRDLQVQSKTLDMTNTKSKTKKEKTPSPAKHLMTSSGDPLMIRPKPEKKKSNRTIITSVFPEEVVDFKPENEPEKDESIVESSQ